MTSDEETERLWHSVTVWYVALYKSTYALTYLKFHSPHRAWLPVWEVWVQLSVKDHIWSDLLSNFTNVMHAIITMGRNFRWITPVLSVSVNAQWKISWVSFQPHNNAVSLNYLPTSTEPAAHSFVRALYTGHSLPPPKLAGGVAQSVVNALISINEVNQPRPRLVLGWVTVPSVAG